MIDADSDTGAYDKAFLYPPFAGAMSPGGEFRRGFPGATGGSARQPDASGPDLLLNSFHSAGDTRG